jgi:predicted NBD/HSP70 family sugar kinase
VITTPNHVPSLRPGERLLLSAVEDLGPASRASLARVTGLPASTVVGLVAKLLADGVLVEQPAPTPADRAARLNPPGSGPGRRSGGRPAKVLALARPAGLVAALAISRHEIRVGAVGLDGSLRATAVLPLETVEVPDVIPAAIDLLDSALGAAGLDRSALSSAVVGVPGPFVRGTGVIALREVPEPIRRFFPGSNPGWMQRDPAPRVAEVLGVPAVAENDANLGAIGEATYGAARGLDVSIYLKYAQGLGAGIVIGGRPLRGASGHGGELAHVRVDDDGPVCGCGGRGCLAVLTSPEYLLVALRRSYLNATAMDDVIALAEHGDPGVLRLLHDSGRLIGRPLADLCTLLNPDAVVLDARLGAAATPLLDGLREMIDRFTLAPAAEAVAVRPGGLGPDAELFGAAALAQSEGLASRFPPLTGRR